MKPKNRLDAITKLKGAIAILENEVTKLYNSCEHSFKPTSPSSMIAKCMECGKWLAGWYCKDSPTLECKYTTDYDSCDYCGEPEERK